MTKILEAYSLQWGVFYLDDGLLVGPMPRLQVAFTNLIEALRGIQLKVNLSKCALCGPRTSDIDSIPKQDALRQESITAYRPESDLKVLGVPVGRPGETGVQDTKLKKKEAAL